MMQPEADDEEEPWEPVDMIEEPLVGQEVEKVVDDHQEENATVVVPIRRVLSIDVGANHYALCALSISNSSTPTIQALESWNLGNVQAVPASRLVDRMMERFAKWSVLETFRPTHVLIEQQMRGAHVNIALGFATYSFLKVLFPQADTRFVRPLAKFATSQTKPLLTNNPIPKGYQQRKRFTVRIAERVLMECGLPSLCEMCPEVKKDDIADAFLQALCP